MRMNATLKEHIGSATIHSAISASGSVEFKEGEPVMEHNDHEFKESIITQTPESIQLQTSQLAVKREVLIADMVVEAMEKGAELNISFMECKSEEEAERIAGFFARKMGRTYQKQEHEGTKWFAIVTHETDRIELSVFYE